jgi:hypothetical protein
MKVIIAGSRHMPFESYPLIGRAVARFEQFTGRKITEVVCGEAKGADTLGKKWAFCENTPRIPVKSFPADWDTYGKGAGPIRNREMAEYAEGLIVFIWDSSRGSANMLQQMQDLDKPCYVVYNGELT